jgi:hypothetical protein
VQPAPDIPPSPTVPPMPDTPPPDEPTMNVIDEAV